MTGGTLDTEECISEGPQSSLERHLIEEYLKDKGFSIEDLKKLPEEEAKTLRKEACMYASLKLAELEAKSQFRDEIHLPNKPGSHR
jgi:hypothetical protein